MVSFFGWGSSSKSDPGETQSQDKSISTDQTKPTQSLPSLQPPQVIQPPAPRDTTNLKLFFGGAAFFTLSLLITRRANRKKLIACIPPYYSSSVYFQPKVNGAAEAFEALNLATINVLSFGMMSTGAVMYALDINTLEDARRVMRAAMDGGASTERSKTDEELEKDVTEWVSNVMGGRFQKQLEQQLELERAKRQTEGNPDEKKN
ncbi:hypothetical protein N7468_009466 [Penicillium chermesinum]|uniref:Altered inheritance of mitochondria protein 11 n=1 Tax=Penicillium chermesinum TaxID=63820 RepID=A0A9W9TEV3_9EURO|nr:uncharacterized protein N7468_009466 [Penicillium chermesinum]KAJ5220262.1 hypothetical protein N7468_009466 [Penicillium chermesinum]KAJ6157705.1 hypothetical protein N7470_005297 [Penicillium chermesinum]